MARGETSYALNRRTGDRRRRRRFVRHEQRSGFDRRAREGGNQAVIAFENTLLRLRAKPRKLLVLLSVVNVLNLADFVLTLDVLDMGGGEANPLMRSLFEMGPVWAGLFKILAVGCASLLVWRCRNYRDALAAGLVMLAIFGAVFTYHVVGRIVFG
jgi:hypothetical protein